MARYRVQGPDGQVHVFEGPDGASAQDVEAFANQTFGGQRAAPQPKPLADDPGVLGTLPIAAGHTVDKVLDGLTQWWLQSRGEHSALGALDNTVKSKDEAYKPLQEAHPVATAVGESAPSMIIPIGGAASTAGNLARLAVAGAAPGALEYGTAGERAGRAAGGAAGSMIGGMVLPKLLSGVVSAVPAIGRTVRAMVEPLQESGRTAIVGRTLNNAAGDEARQAATRLAQAAPLIPGSAPTAAQVAENGGIAALERAAAAANPSEFSARSMEQAAARSGALRQIAGDAPRMEAAKASRQSVTQPMFEQATKANYTVDPRLESLLQRPAVQKAMERAKTLAENEGRTFAFDVSPSAPWSGLGIPKNTRRQITGQGLQDLKMAMDEMLTDPASGFAGKAGDAVKSLRGQLLNWMEDANPVFKTARTTYADMSKPVNQMQIGQELLTKLEPALADHGALAKETAAKYALALRNADQTARAATKFKGAGMADVMEPGQMKTFNAIAQDLARKSNAQDLGRGVGSDTFQKAVMSNIAERSGAPGVVSGLLGLPGVSKMAKFAYAGPQEEIQSKIAQALLDPKFAATLMQQHPALPTAPSTSNMLKGFLLSNPGRPVQVGGGAAGLSLSNLFAQ
jgi:hypothetical protein